MAEKKAPLFTLKNQQGDDVSLSDYLGKKVVLLFYPQDDTPTCNIELCNIRDHFQLLKDNDIVVVGISADAEKKHQKFIEKFELPFTLLADTEKKVIKLYKVWGQKIMFGRKYMGIKRTTFLINENGHIHHIIKKVITKNHAEQILNCWK